MLVEHAGAIRSKINSASSRACLDQLLISIRSLIMLCDHARSKTRLIATMNLTATLGIIYASLHDCGLSEYQLSLPLHRACYYVQTGHGKRGKVESSESVAVTAHYASV